jgi:hypothetical protein
MGVTRTSSESRDVEQLPGEKDRKDQAIHDEFRQDGLSQDDLDFIANFPEEKKKRVIRKVDVSA